MDFKQTLERYRAALDEFSRGNSAPVKKLFSHRDDVTLANPFGPAVKGWASAAKALDFASSRFRDGEVPKCELIAEYVASDLATILEIEHWRAKVSGRDEVSDFTLRVTSTFRMEDGKWRLVHRHADPIASAHPDGPLRSVGDS